MKLKTIDDFHFKYERVLLRVDINAAVVKSKVLDEPRFRESARTIKELLKKKAKLTIIAHQGRKGGSDFTSLDQHAKILSKYVGKKITYVDSLFEPKAIEAINSLKAGSAILLKNVREYESELKPSEDKDYESFCKNFDVYINDAFSVCHREQSSITLPPKYLPSCMGRLLQREIEALSHFKFNQHQHTVYLVGGAKIDDYIPLFSVLDNKENLMLASGVLANLILVSQGVDFGYENSWLKEKGYLELLPKIKELYSKHKEQIILPVDFAIEKNKKRYEVSINDFPLQDKVWDVGMHTLESFKDHIKCAKAVFMKGPLGFSEVNKFAKPTVEVLKEISLLTKKKKLFSLLGGGHLTTTLEKYKIPNNFSYISMSGGALIAQISGKKLPGLEALERSN